MHSSVHEIIGSYGNALLVDTTEITLKLCAFIHTD